MVQTVLLRDDECAVLFYQGGVSEIKHCGVVPECPDCFVDIVLLHCCQVAKAREKTGVVERAPKGGTSGRRWCCWCTGWDRLLFQDHLVKEVSVSKPGRARFLVAAFHPLTKGDMGLRQGLCSAKKAHVDNFYGLCRSDKSRTLSRGSHGIGKM